MTGLVKKARHEEKVSRNKKENRIIVCKVKGEERGELHGSPVGTHTRPADRDAPCTS